MAEVYLCDIRLVGTVCTIYLYNLPPSLAHTKETLESEKQTEGSWK